MVMAKNFISNQFLEDFKMSDNKKMLLIAALFIIASCVDPLLLALGL